MKKFLSRRSWGCQLLLSWALLGGGILVGTVNGADPVRSALERGLFAEESDGDLEAASKAYLEAVRAQAETREMGATALYRLGEVYRKLGRTSDARQMFERLAREFPEQTRWVDLGTARLTQMAPKEVRKPLVSVAFQENLLRQELLIAEQAAAEVQKRIEFGTLAPMEAIGPKREVLRIQRQLLALKDRATGAGSNRAEQRALLVQELEMAQQGQKATQAMMENGKATRTEFLLATKPVLGLQRELAEFDNAVAEPSEATGAGGESAKPGAVTVDDEEIKEVRRLEALLKESPDLLNAVGVDDKTLVEKAAARGRMRELRFLVESGAEIKRTFPLHDAAEAGRKAAVEYLLSRGVDVNALNRNGRTALHLAAEQGRTAVVETLIQAGAFTEARVLPKVMNSIRPVERMSFVDNLMVQLATPLHLAADAGHGAVIEALLRGKANIQATNRTGCTALHLAIQKGQWEVFKLLLEKGADPDALDSRGITPALMTCSSKLGEVTRSSAQPHTPADYLRELLARGVDPNGRKGQWMEALLAAVLVEDLELVECLLKAGAKPQIVNANGMPLLFTALDRRNAIALTRLLLQHGVAPDVHGNIFKSAGAAARRESEWSPVFYILQRQSQDIEVQERNLSVLKILLEAGADPNQANPISGLTPIWFASGRGMGEALIDAGAYIDQPDRDGWPMTSRWTVNVAEEASSGPVGVPGGNSVNGVMERPRASLLPTPSLNDWQSKRAELVGRRGGLWLRSDFNRIRLKLGPELQLAFERGKHDWNHFTALEVLMKGHGILRGIGRERQQQEGPIPPPLQLQNGMYRSGIDWSRILIHRPEPNGTNWQRIPLDLTSVLFRTNCAGDFEMKWGDVIETRPMPGGGTGYLESKTFGCLKRSIRLSVEGETFERVLDPGAKENAPETFSELGGVFEAGTLLAMMGYDSEKYALDKTLVVRRDRQTGNEARMEMDLSRGIHPVDDLWLQDGDRLEFGLRKVEQSVEWAGKVTVFGSRYLAIPVRRGEQLSLGEILRRAGVEREPSSELRRMKVYRFGGDGDLGEQSVDWGSRDPGVEGMVLKAGEMVEIPIRRVAL